MLAILQVTTVIKASQACRYAAGRQDRNERQTEIVLKNQRTKSKLLHTDRMFVYLSSMNYNEIEREDTVRMGAVLKLCTVR